MVRRRGVASDDVEAQLAHIRTAIALIGDQIVAARSGVATAIVSRAEAERTLRAQRRALDEAHDQLRTAVEATRRAAATDPAAVASYETAEAGFDSQLAVVEAARAELSTLSQTTAESAQRAAQVLRRTLESLEEALREQLAVLTRLERLRRERAIAAQRRADQGGWQLGHQ